MPEIDSLEPFKTAGTPPADAPSPESQLPPEERETNGGPLGCCLGIVVGLLLSLSVAILSRLYATPLAAVLKGDLSIVVRVVMVLLVILSSIVFGYLGWVIGKRAYREYEPSPAQQLRLARLQQQQQQRKQKRRASRQGKS